MKTETEISNKTVDDAFEQAQSLCADQELTLVDEDPIYQVWVFDYDKEHNFLGEYMDSEFRVRQNAERAAIERAQISITSLEPEVYHREIEVETVYNFEDFNNPDFCESSNCLTTMTILIDREAEDEK